MKLIGRNVFIQVQKFFILSGVLLTMASCASLGSKTLYHADNLNIPKPAKILSAKPLLVDCIGGEEETFLLVNSLFADELNPLGFTIDSYKDKFIDFDKVTSDQQFTLGSESDSGYLLLTKIKRITAMGQTRDFKVEYKLVSLVDNKLVFHSKYNTALGATIVVIPFVKDFPNSEQLMTIAIRSGLYELKKNLSK